MSRDGSPAVEVTGLVKRFGSVRALDGVDLRVERRTVHGLLGPNGAGKTTLVRILSTLISPDAGTARVAGYDVVRDAASLRSAIGLTGQYAAVDENLTGRENLTMFGRLYHMGRRESRRRADELLGRFGLSYAADRTVKGYSGGMRRRLDIAASLVARPEVLFLDEPTTGLDPRSRIDLWDAIEDLVNEGTTVLLTTQYMEEADHLADMITVIDGGRIIAEGTAKELKVKVGGEILHLRTVEREDAGKAAALLADLAKDAPHVTEETGDVALSLEGGATALPEVVRRLDSAQVQISTVELRQPTLNDVFLAFTGHETGAEEEGSET